MRKSQASVDVASATKADADSRSSEPVWRRTTNGWERAEGWLADAAVRRSDAPPPLHPLLLALLETLISVTALAKWPPQIRTTQ